MRFSGKKAEVCGWTSVVLTAALFSFPSFADNQEREIAAHGEKMVAMLICAHFATEAFGVDAAEPLFADGMDAGRTFYEKVHSKHHDQEMLNRILPWHRELSKADVSPDFSLGYAYAKIEDIAYTSMRTGLDGKLSPDNLNSSKAREFYSLSDCEANSP